VILNPRECKVRAPQREAYEASPPNRMMRLPNSPSIEVMMAAPKASTPLRPRLEAAMCHACGLAYADDAWEGLVLFQRLEPLELRRLVRDWPEDARIEVRSCRRCAAFHGIA